MIYDNEANILCITLGKGDINHARELGNFIVHVSKSGKPILLEILDASKFVGQIDKLKVEKIKKAIPAN